MSKTYYKQGQWNAICDVCGFKYKCTDLRKRWDGLMTCEYDWEPRHPSDFFRAVPDRQSVPWSRPESTDTEAGPAINTSTQTEIPTGHFTDDNSDLITSDDT